MIGPSPQGLNLYFQMEGDKKISIYLTQALKSLSTEVRSGLANLKTNETNTHWRNR